MRDAEKLARAIHQARFPTHKDCPSWAREIQEAQKILDTGLDLSGQPVESVGDDTRPQWERHWTSIAKERDEALEERDFERARCARLAQIADGYEQERNEARGKWRQAESDLAGAVSRAEEAEADRDDWRETATTRWHTLQGWRDRALVAEAKIAQGGVSWYRVKVAALELELGVARQSRNQWVENAGKYIALLNEAEADLAEVLEFAEGLTQAMDVPEAGVLDGCANRSRLIGQNLLDLLNGEG